jgi:hypothetical protein
MIIKWFCKALKFFWRETEVDVLFLVGSMVSGWFCWNMDSSFIYFTSWLMVIASLYGICWLVCLGALFSLLSSEKLNEGGL